MAQKHLKPVIQNLILRYKEILEREFPITQVIVFGSQAKGTASQYSDIDVCVVSPHLGHDRHDERVMLSRFTDGIDWRIEPHPYYPDDLTDPGDPLANEIRKHGISV